MPELWLYMCMYSMNKWWRKKHLSIPLGSRNGGYVKKIIPFLFSRPTTPICQRTWSLYTYYWTVYFIQHFSRVIFLMTQQADKITEEMSWRFVYDVNIRRNMLKRLQETWRISILSIKLKLKYTICRRIVLHLLRNR